MSSSLDARLYCVSNGSEVFSYCVDYSGLDFAVGFLT